MSVSLELQCWINMTFWVNSSQSTHTIQPELIVSDKQLTTTTHWLLTPLPCPWHWSNNAWETQVSNIWLKSFVMGVYMPLLCRKPYCQMKSTSLLMPYGFLPCQSLFFSPSFSFSMIAVLGCPPWTKLFSNHCFFSDCRYGSKKWDQIWQGESCKANCGRDRDQSPAYTA